MLFWIGYEPNRVKANGWNSKPTAMNANCWVSIYRHWPIQLAFTANPGVSGFRD